MWKNLQDSEFFLLFSQDHGYEICVTDYFALWTIMFSEKAFLAQLKLSNDGLELENDNEYIQKGLHLLSNVDKLKKLSIEKENNGKSLFITMTISFGFPFYLECKLSKGSDELYFQKITQPLLKTIGDLRSSQSELRRLLIKKDNEIEEYKCEGGEIVLRHLKTVAFNDEEHMKKHKVYEESFGASDVLPSLIQKAVAPELNVVKQEQIVVENSGPKPNITTEPLEIVKIEPKTEILEEPNTPVISASVSCKQELIKREATSTHRLSNSRKRSKFNF